MAATTHPERKRNSNTTYNPTFSKIIKYFFIKVYNVHGRMAHENNLSLLHSIRSLVY
jgi:hypothetical protein